MRIRGHSKGLAWTAEDDLILKEAWARGMSASQAATLFPGRSRNSLIGRVHRLKLPKRQTKIGLRQTQANGAAMARRRAKCILAKQAKQPVPVAIVAPRPSETPAIETLKAMASIMIETETPKPGHLDLLDLEPHHCRYILNDDPPFHFCGRPKIDGVSYCEDHAALCFGKMPKRRYGGFILRKAA